MQPRRTPDWNGLRGRIRTFDEAVDNRVEPHRCVTFDRIFYPLSSAGDHSALWVAIAVVRGLLSPQYSGTVLPAVIVIGAESLLTNVGIKSAFRRVRPEHPAGDGRPLPYRMRRPITSAFPSGHATSAFTAAMFLSVDDPLAPAYFALAAAVAASRVYTRMHHASDVIAGTALGLAFGAVARRWAVAALRSGAR